MKKIISPLKAIRAHCLDCSTGSVSDVRECICPDCLLYDFRFGKNPHRKKRILTEEQKTIMGARLKKARELKIDSEG